MQFQGALMKEQGTVFAVIKVREQVVRNSFEAMTTRRVFQTVFTGLPIVLVAQDAGGGRALYDGRDDLVRALGQMPTAAIPFRHYTIT
jgi:hypothetical protein